MLRMTKSEREFGLMLGYSISLAGVSGLALIGLSNIIAFPLATYTFYKGIKHGINTITEDIKETQNRIKVIPFNEFVSK